VVREDPVRRGLLYAGTEKGVYASFDDGAHWQPLQQNLPMTSVRDIDVHGDDLVIATHGRGFWIMDNVSALRQLGGMRANTVTLFKPADAIRVRPAGFTGTPFPKDEPMAANPPDGAIIDYALPKAVKAAVTLTVFDAQNHKVRSFSSADPVTATDPTKLEIAPELGTHTDATLDGTWHASICLGSALSETGRGGIFWRSIGTWGHMVTAGSIHRRAQRRWPQLQATLAGEARPARARFAGRSPARVRTGAQGGRRFDARLRSECRSRQAAQDAGRAGGSCRQQPASIDGC
jgi:hypothetical protein